MRYILKKLLYLGVSLTNIVITALAVVMVLYSGLVLYDTVTFNARFRRLRETEEPKAISGTIDYKLTVQNPFSPNDTIKFEIRILDRALHVSNTIQTEPIITNPLIH